MKAGFKAITALLALLVLVAVAAQAGEQGPGDGSWLVSTHGVALSSPADAIRIAQREPGPLRGASVDVRSVEPVMRLARENPERDPESRNWWMLLAGFLGAAAIARRRMSS